eukprot:1185790-Prorocentrum_minimum.AAC.5
MHAVRLLPRSVTPSREQWNSPVAERLSKGLNSVSLPAAALPRTACARTPAAASPARTSAARARAASTPSCCTAPPRSARCAARRAYRCGSWSGGWRSWAARRGTEQRAPPGRTGPAPGGVRTWSARGPPMPGRCRSAA